MGKQTTDVYLRFGIREAQEETGAEQEVLAVAWHYFHSGRRAFRKWSENRPRFKNHDSGWGVDGLPFCSLINATSSI